MRQATTLASVANPNAKKRIGEVEGIKMESGKYGGKRQ
jgi:hypothetical protein